MMSLNNKTLTKSSLNQLLFNHLVYHIQSKRGNQRDGFWLAHIWILLRILTVQKLWDFNFLRGVAPRVLDRFSIGRYEKKRESFDLYPAKLESAAMRFSWGKLLWRWSRWKNGFRPFPSLSGELKILQNRLDLYTYLAICHNRSSKR